MTTTGGLVSTGADLGRVGLLIEASLLSESLYQFVRAAWHVVEPGVAFTDNWHIGVICDHLEAVARGEIRNLIVNIPPRSTKSLLISVLWPAWVWTWLPTHKWLFASYGQALAKRDAVKTRRLIQSTWYQARWGEASDWPQRFKLTSDQNEKLRYENDQLGYRISTSVGGLGTGEGGDIIVVDDPHNVEEAESDAVRSTTLTWWDETMSTRGNDPNTVRKVIVMQRVHENDLTAHCLERGGYDHLCLPMEYDPDHPTRSSTSLGFVDPRRKAGELLWPARFTVDALRALKRSLGEYGTASQLQQRPTPRGGGMFKTMHLRMYPAEAKLPPLEFVVQSYDTAFTEKTTNDPCACTVWGVWVDRSKRRNVLLLDAWNDHLRYAAVRKRLIEDWSVRYGLRDDDPTNPGRRADTILIENKSSGIGIIQELRAHNVPAQSYNPGNADKVARAEQALPMYELGVVWILESKHKPGQFVSWAKPFLDELGKFGPGAARDDYVDTLTQMMIYLRDAGQLDLPSAELDEATPDYTKSKRNPYD